ncbi:MAG: integrase [Methanobrevibacter sp.]|nr:integrase [Candidatus Methanoflexus mossambicus]
MYASALKDYSKFNKMSLKNLIKEADIEEEYNIREKDRKIKKRLEDYRQWKIANGSPSSTIKRYFQIIKTFYRHHEIIIPNISKIKLKNDFQEKYEDIPNKNHIKKAIESTDSELEIAIILFMSSSGTAKNETLNLTINDFIKSTKEYHSNGTITKIINELSFKNDIIPLFSLTRLKTDYHYYTCCSDEATTGIIKYLKTRENLHLNSKLFEINRTQFNDLFMQINNLNKWGKVGFYGFFHSHALRKFHATIIEDKSLADALQGRKRDTITESYYKQNPKRIKEKYLEILPKLRIFPENTSSNSYIELKIENDKLNKRITNLEKKIEFIFKNNIKLY